MSFFSVLLLLLQGGLCVGRRPLLLRCSGVLIRGQVVLRPRRRRRRSRGQWRLSLGRKVIFGGKRGIPDHSRKTPLQRNEREIRREFYLKHFKIHTCSSISTSEWEDGGPTLSSPDCLLLPFLFLTNAAHTQRIQKATMIGSEEEEDLGMSC